MKLTRKMPKDAIRHMEGLFNNAGSKTLKVKSSKLHLQRKDILIIHVNTGDFNPVTRLSNYFSGDLSEFELDEYFSHGRVRLEVTGKTLTLPALEIEWTGAKVVTAFLVFIEGAWGLAWEDYILSNRIVPN